MGNVRVEFGDLLCDGSKVVLQERMRAGLANGRQDADESCFLFELDGSLRIRRVNEYMTPAPDTR